jgi:hypothetical protein
MLSGKLLIKKASSLGWLPLLLAACTGAGGAQSLPTPEPTKAPSSDSAAVVDTGPTRIPADKYADLEIVTLLPRDAIPAIDDPQFLLSEEADEFYDPDELVLGVIFDGDARAYSVPFLSNHEIVNDTVGGVKIAVTW